MNKHAVEKGMKHSNFASAHGMYVEKNVSSAGDMAKLSYHMMKSALFREIVKVPYHEVPSINYPGHTY